MRQTVQLPHIAFFSDFGALWGNIKQGKPISQYENIMTAGGVQSVGWK